MLILKVAMSKSGKKYACLVYSKDNKQVVLTFDTIVILRVTGFTYDAVDDLAVGEYAV